MSGKQAKEPDEIVSYEMSKAWTKPRQTASDKLRERIALEKLISRDSSRIVPATSETAFSPTYPGDFVNFVFQSVSAETLGVHISELSQEDNGSFYGIMAKSTKPGATVGAYASMPALIDAQRFVSFELHSSKADKKEMPEVAALLNSINGPDLVRVKISRFGRSAAFVESAIYNLLRPQLTGGSYTLTHVSLRMSFVSKAQLATYFASDAASYLVSLELHATGKADIKPTVLEALTSNHMFSHLRYLCLRDIKDLDPMDLLDALRLRHGKGCKNPLRAEINDNIDPKISATARTLAIELASTCIF
ncbi:hypothetical protein BD626DRAFT_581374 [Schizophyllum amplum]|uniref:Uncharacterized protein n=1 Tax=Schizophyllum amplum TaxID=97359 RepID=A0A550CV59_9AGAR|nr:hypothetical protein BD626DRAFT_581374 [Auriculariopsis ampla]